MKRLIVFISIFFMNYAGVTLYAQNSSKRVADVETNQSKKSVLWYNEPAPNSGSVSRVKSRAFLTMKIGSVGVYLSETDIWERRFSDVRILNASN